MTWFDYVCATSTLAVLIFFGIWAFLSIRAAERAWQDDEQAAAPEGWDAVRRIDRERRHD